MAFTCGFFNSQNGDRKYNAEQMASIFDGLIKDGVYDTVGDIFAVTPGTGMQVLVGSGRAWFDHTWNNNDAPYPLAITAADVSLPRYDAVVLETNHSDTVRTNRLRVLTGTPASNPVKPTMTSTTNVKQHPLAYIRVTARATAITQSMIQVVVGTSECPFVTGIIETAQIDSLFQQWNGEFDEWFENLKAQLSDNVVANLQNQINQKVNKSDVATTADIEAGTSTTKWVTPKGLRESAKSNGVYDETTGKRVVLESNLSIYQVLNKNLLSNYLLGASTTSYGIFKDRVILGNFKNRTVGSSTKCYPLIDIYDNSGTVIKSFESPENFDSTYNSSVRVGLGEYECANINIAYSSSSIALYGAYFRHKDVICYFSRTGYHGEVMETKNYCIGIYVKNNNMRFYYTANPTNGSDINSWTLYACTFPSNYYYYLLGGYEQYVYIGAYQSNRVYGGGKIYRVDLSSKSFSLLCDFESMGTNNGETLNPQSYIAITYPYLYVFLYAPKNSYRFYTKMVKVDLRDGTNNLNAVLSGPYVSTTNMSPTIIGHDDRYLYGYLNTNGGGYNYNIIRINKSDPNLEIVPSASVEALWYPSTSKQLYDLDYCNIVFGTKVVDFPKLSIISPRTYSQNSVVVLYNSQYSGKNAISSLNTYYLGPNRSSSASSTNLMYNPIISKHLHVDTAIIKE